MQIDLKDKVAVVTGGGGAIGSALCLGLAGCGAKVIVTDINSETAEKTADEIRTGGGEAAAVTADVSKSQSVQELIRRAVEIYGRLDIMVNNAGINGGPDERQRVHEYHEDLWHNILAVDLDGVFLGTKYAARRMREQGTGGSIINIGSINGLTPMRLQCAFTAAKASVFNFTRTAALELAKDGIRVNAIAPGSVIFEGTRKLFYNNKKMAEALLSHIPMGRPGEAGDMAGMTCFLASSAAEYITGTVMTVDGGWICGYNGSL